MEAKYEPLDGSIAFITNPDQSEPGSNSNEGYSTFPKTPEGQEHTFSYQTMLWEKDAFSLHLRIYTQMCCCGKAKCWFLTVVIKVILKEEDVMPVMHSRIQCQIFIYLEKSLIKSKKNLTY